MQSWVLKSARASASRPVACDGVSPVTAQPPHAAFSPLSPTPPSLLQQQRSPPFSHQRQHEGRRQRVPRRERQLHLRGRLQVREGVHVRQVIRRYRRLGRGRSTATSRAASAAGAESRGRRASTRPRQSGVHHDADLCRPGVLCVPYLSFVCLFGDGHRLCSTGGAREIVASRGVEAW